MADYRESEEQTVKLGGLQFTVKHRELGEDGGPTIEVYGDVEGQSTQVLRFDCFRNMPHYHAPATNPEQLTLDPAEVGDSLEWSLSQIRSHLPELLRKAGFQELAVRTDLAALFKGWVQIKEAVAATAPSA